MAIDDAFLTKFKTRQIPPVSAIGHTMPEADFNAYIANKLTNDQKSLLREHIRTQQEISVIALPDTMIARWMFLNGMSSVRSVSRASREGKRFNNRRPTLHLVNADGGQKLFLSCMPSIEYLYQMSDILATHIAAEYREGPRVNAVYFPEVAANVVSILGFDQVASFLQPHDFVIFGEIDALIRNLHRVSFRMRQEEEFGFNKEFALFRIVAPNTGRTAALIASKETYFGSILARYVEYLTTLGIDHFFYCAKAGRFEDEQFAHEVFTPGSYACINRDFDNSLESHFDVEAPPSLLRSQYRHLILPIQHGLHLSVPSVVGETRQQSKALSMVRPSTIDNETSYVAHVINENNKANRNRVTFDCMHFITDILRSEDPEKRGVKIRLADKVATNATFGEAKDRKFEFITSLLSQAIMDNGLESFTNRSFIISTFLQADFRVAMDQKIERGHGNDAALAKYICMLIWYAVYTGNYEWVRVIRLKIAQKMEEFAAKGQAVVASANILSLALTFVDIRRKIARRNSYVELGQPIKRTIETWTTAEKTEIFDELHEVYTAFGQYCSSADASLDDCKATQQLITATLLANISHFLAMFSANLDQKDHYTHWRGRRDRWFESGEHASRFISNEEDQVLQFCNHIRDEINCAYNERKHLERLSKLDWYAPDSMEKARTKANEVSRKYQHLLDALRAQYGQIPYFVEYEYCFFLISMVRLELFPERKRAVEDRIRQFLGKEKSRTWSLIRLGEQFDEYVSPGYLTPGAVVRA
jgi:hypothetical protein